MSQQFNSKCACLLLMLWVFLSAPNLHAQLDNSCSITVNGGIYIESSPRPAQSSFSVPYLDHVPWLQNDNIYLPDNRFVETTLQPNNKSELLIVNNFDFDIPVESIITGIEVRFIGGKTGSDTIKDKRIQLIDDRGALVGRNKFNKAIYGNEWNQDSIQSRGNWIYGSNQDIWDFNWTPEMVNSPSFGVAIQLQNIGEEIAKVMLDQVMIRIYHIPAIDICQQHACISVYSVPEDNVVDYDWTVSDDMVHQDSTNAPYAIILYADQSPFGSYEVCLTKTYNDGTTSSCCRNVIYRPCGLGSIGNLVWQDTNGNGNQDSGEPGIDDVRVYLYNESEEFLAESDTKNGGKYLFDNLEPGNYFVEVATYDYCPTIGEGNSENTDSDFLQAISPRMSELVILQSNQNIQNIDFGLIIKGSISGLAWIDVDGNGEVNTDDILADGIEVQLQNISGDVIMSSVTDESGEYIFNDVPPGEYIVYFAFDSEFINTDLGSSLIDENFKTTVVMLDNGGNVTDVNGGVFRYSSIGDLVWFDENENGIFDNGESGLENISVRLKDCNGSVIGFTGTDTSGFYIFDELLPQQYIVCVESSRPDIRPLETGSVDIVGGEACSSCINLLENTQVTNIDFAFINAFVQIDVNVWFDNDVDGTIDSDELFSEETQVSLFDCSNTLIETINTNSSGFVRFDSLLTGSYYVSVIAPDGEVFSLQSDVTNANGEGTTDCLDVVPLGITLNLGLVQLSSIGDFIWEDSNRNGIQDQDEFGIIDVPISIFDCNGVLVDETVSLANGAYVFSELLPGEYSICPSFDNVDYIPTISNEGTDLTGSDFDDSLTTNCSACFTLEPNIDRSDMDFGYVRKQSTITVSIWDDLNYNALNDNEDPNSSITISLYNCNGELLRSTSSDINGIAEFNQLYLEEYYIEITLENGLTIHPDGSFSNLNGENTTDCILLTESGASIEVPLVMLSSIGDYVWEDGNGNGIQDSDEAGIPNLIISLQDCNGLLINQTTTGDNGEYLFENIIPGEYFICLDDPGNFFTPTEFVSNDDENNSDFDLSAGSFCSSCFTVTTFSDNFDLDFGFVRDISEVSVEVWFDNDGDGRFDSSESPSEGTAITLFDCNGVEIETAITDANGIVNFVEIGLGEYYIQAEEISGFDFSSSTSITDANGVGTSNCFTLTHSGVELEVGYIGPASIGDFVWLDINDNGMQDVDEPGIEGITLNLLNSLGVIQETVMSDADGKYLFDNLSPDVYRVIIVGLNPSYSLTRPEQASESLDSDFERVGSLISTPVLTLSSNETNLNVDLGLVPAPIQINGIIWRDSNGNTLNDNEIGQENLTVSLYNCDGNLVSETNSDPLGNFVFPDVEIGEYYVQVSGTDEFQFLVGGDSDITNTNGESSTDCITIDGTASLTLNIGATPMSNMRTQVFVDENQNGILENSDTNLSNVSVVLRDMADAEMDIQLTDNNGEVYFENIYPGQYRLELMDVESGLAPTLEGQGSEDEDSDLILDGSRFLTEAIDIIDGVNVDDVDLGLIWVTGGKVAGDIWRDINGDLDAENEDGLESIVINLFDCNGNLYESIETDANGHFQLSDVPEGDYYLQVVSVEGYDIETGLSSDISGLNDEFETICFSVNNFSQINFETAFIPLGSIGDWVWLDSDSDGVQDSGEQGIADIELLLLNDNDEELESTFTDTDGFYTFTNLRPSAYRVEIKNLETVFNITTSLSGNIETDSDLIEESGRYVTDFIVIEDGFNNLNIDLGLIESQTIIAGRVFEDRNKNGLHDFNEFNLENIAVLLQDLGGNFVSSTFTDGFGEFYFLNVEPNEYIVVFELLSDYAFSPLNIGADEFIDSDVINTLGETAPIIIEEGDVILNITAGMYDDREKEKSSVSGFLWEDDNGNGILELASESGTNDITVSLYSLYDELIQTMQTSTRNDGREGYYIFENVEVGDYYVSFDLDNEKQITTSFSGSDQSLDSHLTSSHRTSLFDLDIVPLENINGGYYSFSTIGDYVWLDLNDNGFQDIDETGIDDVVVNLMDEDLNIVSTTISNNGDYYLNDIAPGRYFLSVDAVQGYVFSQSLSGGINFDSDITNENGPGTTYTFDIRSGQAISNIDIGLVRPGAQVGNRVWEDINANGIQDPNEPGLNGVLVSLIDLTGYIVQEAITFTSNFQPGTYLFRNVVPGEYYIEFYVDAEYRYSPYENTGDASNDTDVTGEFGEGTTSVFELEPGELNMNIDCGVFVPVQIGDLVWLDLNLDGNQDIDEPGFEGLLVELWNDNDEKVSETYTDENGNYLFDEIIEGSYFVNFNTSDDLLFTTKETGIDTNTDSDALPDGTTELFDIASRQVRKDLDAGLINTVNTIAGKTWFDENDDGLIDINEDAISNVAVWLLDGSGSVVLDETFTNEFGQYNFSDIEDGAYVIQFSPLSGRGFTGQDFGSDEKDSDCDASGYTSKIIMTNNETVEKYVSAGYVDITESKISEIYPNPAHGETIKLEITNTFRNAHFAYSIADAQGSVVRSSEKKRAITGGVYSFDIPIADLLEGIYFVKVKVNNITEYHKIMIFK